jgi:hypothetical protein
VWSPEADLAAALDALIGNVFAHTQPGTGLAVSVHRSNGPYVDVVVEDAGDGFPDDLSASPIGGAAAPTPRAWASTSPGGPRSLPEASHYYDPVLSAAPR